MSNTEVQQQFVTLAEAVAIAKLSEISIRRAVKRGELQFYRASNYRLHLDKAELTEWLAKRAVPQPLESHVSKKK